MSNYDCMKAVPRDQWPYGYLFSEVYNREHPKLHSEKCKVHFCFRDTTKATVYFKINAIDKKRRYYSLLVFKDDRFEKEILFVEVRYVDEFATTANFHITFISPEFRSVADALLKVLHSIVVDLVINMPPPMDKDGKLSKAWYVGFTQKNLAEIEYYSKNFVLPLTLELMETVL